MVILGLVLVSIAALFHVYVFVLESLTWRTPRTRATFGIRSDEEAEATTLLAYNQGFYNLFLAIGTGVGVVLVLTGSREAGFAVITFGAGAMAAAGVVLAASQPTLIRAAALQFLPPALGLAALGFGTMV